MSFDSLTYAVFLPAVCLIHWQAPAKWRWAVLLAASYVFYASWNVSLSLLILGVTACSYLAGRLIGQASSPLLRRACLAGALAVSLGLLGYFKYFNLLGRSIAALFGRGEAWQTMDIALPVGVSFYTFQAISYVVDVYRNELKAERHFGYYALYISFFPQLVAGPIERAGALLPQLRGERRLSREDLSMGSRLLISGLFRKLVAADLVAPFVDVVYQAAAPDGSAVLIATLLFAVQIYGDFSGYSEIAAGSARLLGVHLMRNFDRPYGARNIREFWRRWHISLTVWFTEYVYIPLGGSRNGLMRQLFAASVVFALCGLWHGAEWNFVVWGMLHAVYLNLYTISRRVFPSRKPEKKEGLLSRGLTLAAVCFAWLFFRANDMQHAAALLHQLFSAWNLHAGIALLMSVAIRGAPPLALLMLLAGILLVLRRLPSLSGEDQIDVPDMAWTGLLLAIAVALLIRFDSGTANAFIYFQF